MPSAQQILLGLFEAANTWRPLAVGWHIYFALLLAWALTTRPTKRTLAILLALPLFSVSGLAWLVGNPFNGTVFALAAIGLIAIAARLPRLPVGAAPLWGIIAGLIMFVFGWGYPHFLRTEEPLVYLYAAPVGLIPCPTLAAVSGLALATRGLDSRAWSLTLAVLGLFYGLLGTFFLSIRIDIMLAAGSALLCMMALKRPSQSQAAAQA